MFHIKYLLGFQCPTLLNLNITVMKITGENFLDSKKQYSALNVLMLDVLHFHQKAKKEKVRKNKIHKDIIMIEFLTIRYLNF